MRKWKATRQGVSLEEYELIRSKTNKNDLKWIFNNGNSSVNQKFIDTEHGWFDDKKEAEEFVNELRKAEQNGNVQRS